MHYENLYSTEIHPVANNMREHREKNLPSKLFFLISTSSLGIKKLKYILQSLIVPEFVDLKSFIKNGVTTKSSAINNETFVFMPIASLVLQSKVLS